MAVIVINDSIDNMYLRDRIISFFKANPSVVRIVWRCARCLLRVWGWFVPVQKKTMIFCSFGGRKYDDSPKALYEEVCRRTEFDGWRLIWAFVEPDKYTITRGDKLKVDTMAFFKALLQSRVWVSNSGMDRGIGLKRKGTIRVETWHGTPLKKIGGEEHQNSLGKSPTTYKGKKDGDTIRCAQSEFDREIFARINHAEKSAILLSDLPRNDSLLSYTDEMISEVKCHIGITADKKVILYMPTYREYLVDEKGNNYIAPPLNFEEWKRLLGDGFVVLIRAHYAVTAALNVCESDFLKDVSAYPFINDLYAVSDILVSDYSSAYFDYSILDRPMLCFAYDLNEYEHKRGLYLNLESTLPCVVDYDENSLLKHIMHLDYAEAIARTKEFHHKYAPYAGHASKDVIDIVLSKINKSD